MNRRDFVSGATLAISSAIGLGGVGAAQPAGGAAGPVVETSYGKVRGVEDAAFGVEHHLARAGEVEHRPAFGGSLGRQQFGGHVLGGEQGVQFRGVPGGAEV